jgi:glycosyltransferase involved in cell wall biosynthesis
MELKKTKVVYVVSNLVRCGPTQQLLFIVKFLDRNKFEPIILTIYPEPQDSLIEKFNSLDVPVISLNLSRFQCYLTGRFQFEKTIREFQPNLLQSQGFSADWISSGVATDIPRISVVRGTVNDANSIIYGKWKSKLINLFYKNFSSKSKYLIGVSEAVTQSIVNFYGFAQVKTIQNGVDTSTYFPVDTSTKKQLRKELNLPELSEIWISCGHLSKRKNPLLIISAWQSKFLNDDSRYLIFLGSGELETSCKSMAANSHNILFLGHVNNVADYLRSADYFVSASLAEGFPNSVLEAMACGLPTVLSSIEPHKEILALAPGSKIGNLFDPSSTDALCSAISEILSHSYDSISSECSSFIEKRLSALNMSYLYQGIYDLLTL